MAMHAVLSQRRDMVNEEVKDSCSNVDRKQGLHHIYGEGLEMCPGFRNFIYKTGLEIKFWAFFPRPILVAAFLGEKMFYPCFPTILISWLLRYDA